MSFLRSTFAVGALTSLSRVLGLVREMLQSRLIGAGVEQSAFTLAFAIPNMARKLFGEGALTAAFVPVFKGELEKEGLEKARALARAVLTMAFLMLGAAVLLAVAGLSMALDYAPWGFAANSEACRRTALILRLTRLLLPYMLFICGAAFGMGVLNAMGKFKAAAFMPSMLNVFWIAALAVLLFLGDWPLSRRVVFVCWAILLAGAAQMAFMFVCMRRRGISPRFTFRGWGSPPVRLVWHNTCIAALGAGAVQINYMLDQVLGQIAAPWAAGVIGYAERLMDLPLGVIGVAFGTVLLPTFAGHFARGDQAAAQTILRQSLRTLLFVMIPSATGLCVLAPEIVRVIYEGNAFDAQATVRVARALAVYALGLGFFGCQKSFVPWFQAQNDMRTPLRVSVATVFLNATLNILAVFLLPVEWRHVGLAASTVVCAAAGCALLIGAAYRRNGALGLVQDVPDIVRMLFAAVGMASVLYFLRSAISSLFAPLGDKFGEIVSLGMLVLAGIATYGALSLLCFGSRVRTLLRRRR